MGPTAGYDLAFWSARLHRGQRRVTLRGDASLTGSIRRVTTAAVWVRWRSEDHAQPTHPDDIRPAGIYDGLSACDLWNMGMTRAEYEADE